MTTARDEISDAVAAYDWEALASPKPKEMIYRRLSMLVFCQYDREGKLREATLRRMIAPNLTTEVASIGWTDGVKVWHVTRWLAEYGQSAKEARDLARRRRARR
jgi:hypothetical protein